MKRFHKCVLSIACFAFAFGAVIYAFRMEIQIYVAAKLVLQEWLEPVGDGLYRQHKLPTDWALALGGLRGIPYLEDAIKRTNAPWQADHLREVIAAIKKGEHLFWIHAIGEDIYEYPPQCVWLNFRDYVDDIVKHDSEKIPSPKTYELPYPDGSKSIAELQNWIPHGMYRSYHPNGKIKLKENQVNGKSEGLSETFDNTGKLTRRRWFKNGKVVKTETIAP